VPDNKSSLRMGGEVPVPSTTFTPVKEGEKPANPIASYSYRRIGTNIDVQANTAFEGQYRISLTIEDNSIYPPDLAPATTKTTGAPAFRGFASSNVIALRDGQTLDYTMATDRLTGEVYRVSVKLTVVK
jgi:type II secretory pathway component GspD/PulD (secretin)